MRAAEFMRALADIIDKLDGNESNDSAPDDKDPNPVMVPPLQQQLELEKAEQGKDSPVIRKLTQSEQ